MNSLDQSNRSRLDWKSLNATRFITAAIGSMLAIAGFNHGFFEALQGNKPTSGLIIQAIGQAQRMWPRGTEEAFTLIPNYFATGLCSMGVGILLAIWSWGFVHKKYGQGIFLSLCVLLTLVGGGIGHIAFFLPAWAYATRINKPLSGWKKLLPGGVRRLLAKIWPFTLALAALGWLVALEIAIFGYLPGQKNPEILLAVCWSSLLVSLLLINLTYISGFAYDIERQQ